MNLFELDSFSFWYIVCVVFVFGVCFGSFSNVVILRAFSGESIVLPPSKCPHCKNKLKWYHNIPVLSYLFLRGKCGFCKGKISPQYPIVEAIMGLLFVAIFLKFGLVLKSVFLCAVAFMCVVLAVTDIKEQVIFDAHAYILGVIGLVYNFFDIGKSGLSVYNLSLFSHSVSVNKSFVYALLGVVAGALLMEGLAFVGKLFVGKRAFGEGDSFIMGAFGAVFGIKSVMPIFILGAIAQVIIVLPMFIKGLLDKKDYKLLVGLGALVVTIILFKVLDMVGVYSSLWAFLAAFLVLLAVALYVCLLILRSAKDGSGLTYVPFGPPLVFAALALMFLGL